MKTEELEASFRELESANRGHWLDELKGFLHHRVKKSRGLGRRWLFLSFVAPTTFVNVFESARFLRSLSALHRSGKGEENGYAQDPYKVVELAHNTPVPLAVGYLYSNLHIEPDAGLWINGVALQRLLRCPTLKHPLRLDPQAHANDWESAEERAALLWRNALAVDIYHTLRFCGVLVLHSPRMVPHATTYLPYSTYRRTHAPSVSTAVTIGNVVYREQMQAMAKLVQRRACWDQDAKVNARVPQEVKPRFPFQMRALGGESPLNLTARHWYFPGGRYLGMKLVAFRSEHFLTDAQAAGSTRS